MAIVKHRHLQKPEVVSGVEVVRAPTLHDDLVARAVRWLRGSRRCCLVLSEKPSPLGETPDAIGWCGFGRSILVECKTSLADYAADQRKIWRQTNMTMAQYCYYLTPQNLLDPAKLPTAWGLLEIRPATIRTIKAAEKITMTPKALWAEHVMLISEARPDTRYQAERDE